MRDDIADVINRVKFYVNRFGGFEVLTSPILAFSIGLAGRPYNSVITICISCCTDLSQCRQSAAHVACAASAVAPVPFLNRMTFSKSAILHRFPNFYTLMADISGIFSVDVYVRMTPLNHETFHGNRQTGQGCR